MERWDSAMTTTPLIPNGLNSWKTTSTIVACARFAASMRELFTASRLLMDSESQSNNSRSRCRPKAFNPAASFRLRPSTAPLLQRAHRRRCYAAKKLAAAKNKVTVGSRKVDCKKKTRLDTFFDPAPAKFAARSPASHVALAVGAERHERAGPRQSRGDHLKSRSRATRAGWIVFVGSPRARGPSPNPPAARTAASREPTADRRRLVSPPQACDPTGRSAAASTAPGVISNLLTRAARVTRRERKRGRRLRATVETSCRSTSSQATPRTAQCSGLERQLRRRGRAATV